MVPIIIVSGWLHALAFMHEGYWSTLHAAGQFWSTPRVPHGPVFGVSRNGMAYLIRHGYECTHAARGSFCAADQIR